MRARVSTKRQHPYGILGTAANQIVRINHAATDGHSPDERGGPAYPLGIENPSQITSRMNIRDVHTDPGHSPGCPIEALGHDRAFTSASTLCNPDIKRRGSRVVLPPVCCLLSPVCSFPDTIQLIIPPDVKHIPHHRG